MKKIILLLVVLLTFLISTSYAQDEQGTLISLRPGLIVIDVWGDDLQDHFLISDRNALDNLSLGDVVDIQYQGEGNSKIATSVIKELPVHNIL